MYTTLICKSLALRTDRIASCLRDVSVCCEVRHPGISPACDVITFYPERQHLCSNCNGEQALSNDTYTSVIRLIELEICTKTLQNFSGKLRGKCPFSTLRLSMVSSSCLFCSFLEILLLERSLVEGQKLQQKERKKRKRKSEKEFE